MKRLTAGLVALVVLLIVGGWIVWMTPPQPAASKPEAAPAGEAKNTVAQTATLPEAQPAGKPPVSIELGAFAIKRMPEAEWERIRQRDNLTLASPEKYIENPIPVTVEMAPLRAVRNKEVTRLAFDLGLPAPVIAEVAQVVEHGLNAYTITGKMEGNPNSDFSLSVYEDAVVGRFQRADLGLRQLRQAAPGVYKVEEFNSTLAPGCGVGPQHETSAGPIAGASPAPAPVDTARVERIAAGLPPAAGVSTDGDEGGGGTQGGGGPETDADENTIHDVLVLYTAEGLPVGGVNEMLALINMGVVDANTAYQASSMGLTLRLVGTAQTNYTGSLSDPALTALRSTTDGVMDEVHQMRTTLGADMVCLASRFTDYGGLAYVMTSLSTGFKDNAFSTVNVGSIVDLSFAHELGHNCGCRHAVGDGTTVRGSGVFPYSHGWRWFGTNSVQYRSIMAYSPGTRVKQFSDPNVLYQGTPSGVADSDDNARSITNAKDTVAQFYSSAADDHGDITANATTVSTNSTTFALLDSTTDVDVFRFVVTIPSQVTVQTTGTTNTGGRLKDASDTVLFSDSNSGTAPNFRIQAGTLPAGTYYAEVFAESIVGSYTLSVAVSSGDDHGEDISTATTAAVPGTVAGNLTPGGDLDFFRLTLPVSGTLEVSTTGITDTYGSLHAASGAVVQSDDDSGTGSNFLLSRSVIAGTHYVQVRGSTGSVTGPYTLQVNFVPDVDDHGSSFATATLISAGTSANPSVTSGELESFTDHDYFRIDIPDPDADLDADQVTLDMNGPPAPPAGGTANRTSFTEDGFTIRASTGTLSHDSAGFGGGTTFAENGTAKVRILGGYAVEFTETDGSVFTPKTIDMAEYSTSNPTGYTVIWTGYLEDGTTVSQNMATDGVLDGTGGAADFQTFTFSSLFTNIVRLVNSNSVPFTVDNLVVERDYVVPPTSWVIDGDGATPGVITTVSTYSEDGFTIKPISSGVINRIGPDMANFANNGTGILHIGNGSTFQLTSASGDLFDITQIDLGENSTSFQTPKSIAFTGYRLDGTSVSHTFVTDGIIDGTGPLADLQTFTFPATFTNLLRLESTTINWCMDNLNVSINPSYGNLTVSSLGSTDTFGRLYGTTGIEINANDSGGFAPNFAINRRLPPGTYYLRVNEFGENATGSYTLLLAYGTPPSLPAVPASPTASSNTHLGINLAWTASAHAARYMIFRNTVNSTSGAMLLASNVSGVSYQDTTATAGQAYYYWIVAANSRSSSTYSASATGTRLVPAPVINTHPATVSTVLGSNAVFNVTATALEGALHYQWYLGVSGNLDSPIGDDSASLTVAAITPLQVWVRVTDDLGSTNSNTATLNVLLPPPALVSASDSLRTDGVSVRWRLVPNALSYRVYRATTDSSAFSSYVGPSTDGTYLDTSATPGVDYYYFIRTLNAQSQEGPLTSGDPNLYHRGRRATAALTGTLLPIQDRVDFVYSPDGQSLYVSSETGAVDQYSISLKTITKSAFFGLAPGGIDVDSTGNFVLVAKTPTSGSLGVSRLNFGATPVTEVNQVMNYEGGETGVFDVRYVSESLALATTAGPASSRVLQFDPRTSGTPSHRADVPTGNGLVASRTFFSEFSDDRTAMFQKEPSGSGWFTFDSSGNTFGANRGHTGKALFAAISPDGSQYAISTDTQVKIYQADGTLSRTINRAGGVAFAPLADQFYIVDMSLSQVVGYSTITWAEVFNVAVTGGVDVNEGIFGKGRVQVRPDGRELAVACRDGIRLFNLDAYIPSSVPGVPQSVAATTNSATQVGVSWNAVSSPAYYSVYRNTTNDFASSTKLVGNLTTAGYVDSAVSSGVMYYYWVTTRNYLGESAASSLANGHLSIVTPTSLSATDADTEKISLAWSNAGAGYSYEIYSGTTATVGNATLLATVTTNSYEDTTVMAGLTRYHWVRSLLGNVRSGFSNVDTGFRPFGEVTGLTATAALSSKVTVSWNAVSGATDYDVYFGPSADQAANQTNGTQRLVGSTTGTSIDDPWTNFPASFTYYWFVRPRNSAFQGNFSGAAAGNRVYLPPTNVAATSNLVNQVLVTWGASADAGFNHYQVLRSTTANFANAVPVAQVTTASSQWIDPSAVVNVPYHYWVRAKHTNVTYPPGELAGPAAGVRPSGYYGDFLAQYGLSGANASILADVDLDEYNNLAEWGLGSNPLQPGSSPVFHSRVLEISGQKYYGLCYLRFKGGTESANGYTTTHVRYEAEGTTDLVAWTLNPVPATAPSDLPAAPLGYEWGCFRSPEPIVPESHHFIRMKLSTSTVSP